jgi:hypothetical protein
MIFPLGSDCQQIETAGEHVLQDSATVTLWQSRVESS